MTLYEAIEKNIKPRCGGCVQFKNISINDLDNPEDLRLYNLVRNATSIKMIVSIKDVKLQPGLLSTVFNLPNLKDSFDNDILFIFEGLLDKKSGGNIRNEVAHGLLTEKEASGGVCLYFVCAVIKLLSYGTLSCNAIRCTSEKLKEIKKMSEDMLPKRIEGLEA